MEGFAAEFEVLSWSCWGFDLVDCRWPCCVADYEFGFGACLLVFLALYASHAVLERADGVQSIRILPRTVDLGAFANQIMCFPRNGEHNVLDRLIFGEFDRWLYKRAHNLIIALF